MSKRSLYMSLVIPGEGQLVKGAHQSLCKFQKLGRGIALVSCTSSREGLVGSERSVNSIG